MALNYLEFVDDGDKGYLVKNSGSLKELWTSINEGRKAGPVVILFAVDGDEELEKFVKLEYVKFCKEKNKGSGLFRYIPGETTEKSFLIKADYKGINQIKRSLRDLFRNLKNREITNLAAVATSNENYMDLLAKIESEETKSGCVDELEKIDPAERKTIHLHGKDIDITLISRSFVGEHSLIKEIQGRAMLAASIDMPVLITGPPGTGKGLLARQIHENSSRRNKRFVHVNSSNLRLFEAELFGHVKGSFTGATDNKEGLWEYAGDGTLFLDEIGDMDLAHQVKILDAIERKKIRRVGGVDEIDVQARVIAATNRDLKSLVLIGTFRDDLYYRIRGLNLETPGLRYHLSDIPILAKAIWKGLKADGKLLTDEIIQEMRKHPWPGNVRELKNILQQLQELYPGEYLTKENLYEAFKLGRTNIGEDIEAHSKDDIKIHKLSCFQHLKAVDDVVKSILKRLKPLEKMELDNLEKREDVAMNLEFIFSDLKKLNHEDKELLFLEEGLFDKSCQAEEQFERFFSELKDNGSGKLKTLAPLKDKLKDTKSELFKVMGKFIK